MIQWWDSLDTIVKILYCIAIPATLVLIIQTIMAMLGGMDGGAGIDTSDTSGLDFSGDTSSDFDTSALGNLPDATDISDIHSAQHMTDGGNPADLSALRLFTLQGMVAFLTVFSWSSIASISSGAPMTLSVLLGTAFGLVAMFAIAKLIQVSSKLTENGTLDLKNAIGETGNVYIPIPPKGKGEGKLTMYLQGRYMECSAITDSNTALSTGTSVRITDVRNGDLVVEQDK